MIKPPCQTQRKKRYQWSPIIESDIFNSIVSLKIAWPGLKPCIHMGILNKLLLIGCWLAFIVHHAKRGLFSLFLLSLLSFDCPDCWFYCSWGSQYMNTRHTRCTNNKDGAVMSRSCCFTGNQLVALSAQIAGFLLMGGGGGGTPRNSWWGCAARVFKSRPYFRPKHAIFHTRFQTWPLKFIPVFRPELENIHPSITSCHK